MYNDPTEAESHTFRRNPYEHYPDYSVIPPPPPPPAHEPLRVRLAWVLFYTLLIVVLGLLYIWRIHALGGFPATSAPSAAILLLWFTTRVGIRRKGR